MWVFSKHELLDLLTRTKDGRVYARLLRPCLPRAGLRTLSTTSDPIHGFQLKDTREISELSLVALRYQHMKTGAEYIHLDREDNNKVFCVGFTTPPQDSTGAPHILEHVTLCGSQKYPVRDPFFKMLNRTMANFMNAFTACDYTMYPFATENWKDYEHLRDIYMDAVFHPLLRPLDFLQEGWRLERSNPEDPHPWMEYKGVVFNEMKGALSDPGQLFATRVQQLMYPNSPYAYVSGGDPLEMPNLSYKMLKEFHAKHYHPSNARFLSYGRLPLEKQLAAVDEKISIFQPSHKVVIPNTYHGPSGVRREIFYGQQEPMLDPERQVKVSLTFLGCDARNIYESFCLSVLGLLLTDGPAAPFYRGLIEAGLGTEFSPNTGYNTATSIGSFSIGLQGVHNADIDKVFTTIRDILVAVHRDGFAPERIEAVLHELELSYRHKTATFGLQLAQAIFQEWCHGADPTQVLEIEKHISRLRNDITQGKVFTRLIETYLLNNNHVLESVMLPDPNYHEKLQAKEYEQLEKLNAQLTQHEIQEHIDNETKLLANQNKVEDVGCLPSLQLSDVAPTVKSTPLTFSQIHNISVQQCLLDTNGVSYLKLIAAMPTLPEELLPLVPFYCEALTMVGTTNKDAAAFDDEVRRFTGGISAAPFLAPDPKDIAKGEFGVALGVYALEKNIPKMYTLLGELLQNVDFSRLDRLNTLLQGRANAQVQSIIDSGHVLARLAASSALSSTQYVQHIWSGISQIEYIQNLVSLGNIDAVAEKLMAIHRYVLERSSIRVAVNTWPDVMPQHQALLTDMLAFIKPQPDQSNNILVPSVGSTPPARTAYTIEAPTGFAATVYPTVPYTHPDNMPLQVLSSLMTHRYLHREIREKGGAYDGGAVLLSTYGTFAFHSYRDPTALNSLDVFQAAIDWAYGRSFTDAELSEAKLSIFSSLDTPIGAIEEGMLNFRDRISDEMRQARRNILFNVTNDDVHRVCDKYLRQCPDRARHAILCDPKQAPQTCSDWQVISLGAAADGQM